MPLCSTRSTATRATLSMSTSLPSSSCTRNSNASGTFMRRLRVRPWMMPGQHVLDVDVDLLDRRAGNHLERRKRALAHVELDRALVEPAVAQLLAELLARLVPRILRRHVGHVLDVARRHRRRRRARATRAAAAAADRAAAPRRSARPCCALPRAAPRAPCRRPARRDRAPSTRRRGRRSRPR